MNLAGFMTVVLKIMTMVRHINLDLVYTSPSSCVLHVGSYFSQISLASTYLTSQADYTLKQVFFFKSFM